MKVNRAFKFQFLKICLFKTKHFYSLNLSTSSVKISCPQKNPQVGIPSGWDPAQLFEKIYLISAWKCLFITEEISNFSSTRSYYKISTKYFTKDLRQYIQYNILFKQCFFLQRNLWRNRVFFLTLNFHLADCHQASVFSIAMHFITIFFAPNVKGFTCKLLEEMYLNKRV